MHSALIAMFRKRERNLCFGEIQNETAESAGQTASRLEASLRESFHHRSPTFLANFLYRINQRANSIRRPNARQVITSSRHPHFRKENSALHGKKLGFFVKYKPKKANTPSRNNPGSLSKAHLQIGMQQMLSSCLIVHRSDEFAPCRL